MSLSNEEKHSDSKLSSYDNDMLEDLFITYKSPLYQFIYRYTQDEQVSIDIVQDTFIKFQKYKSNFDETKSSIKTFLFRIGYQLTVNRLKKQSRMQKLLPFFYQSNGYTELAIEDRITIEGALKQLPSEQRAVILLTYYHDLTQKEIAHILQIPVGTVKSRIHTAIKKLKQLLEV